MTEEKGKYLYVVVSQTGTIISKIIQRATKAKFCHVSVSLEKNLGTMYSFGRRYAYTPLFGGFVQETPQSGVFKRYPKTEAVILAFPLSEQAYAQICLRLREMYEDEKRWKYNYLGAILAGIRKRHSKKGKYYCSEFVRELLLRYHVTEEELPAVMRPTDFLSIFKENRIYEGKLQAYCKQENEE